MKIQEVNFNNIINDINNNKILLPDFQRGFEWKEPERQIRLVASVLSKMPIGSILLLNSKSKDFLANVIGINQEIIVEDEKEAAYLLDGQQRITVLANVFSNIIFDKCCNYSKLKSQSLKRRFFLRIPKWKKVYAGEEDDWFGIRTLFFPYSNPDSQEPEFMSSNIFEYIEYKSFLKDDKKPYNPQCTISQELDDMCLNNQDGYLIPLYLLINIGKNERMCRAALSRIINKISAKIVYEIQEYYINNHTKDLEAESFLNQFLEDEQYVKDLKSNEDEISNQLETKRELWAEGIKDYLKSCLRKVNLEEIIVEESKRARAIDIYENMNMGGISLSTFDLIMAKAAKVSRNNFYNRIVSYMQKERNYEKYLVPDNIINYKINEYNNYSIKLGAIKEDTDKIEKEYINVFLNVLSLYCNNKEMTAEKISIEYTKQDKILLLYPEDIDKYSEKVCDAIDRALFFFCIRCGIRNIKEINNKLLITIVAFIFMDDKLFSKRKVHDVLEGWYWSVLFAGEFDKDQNNRMKENLKKLIQSFSNNDYLWIKDMRERVFNEKNYSDKEFILLENAEATGRYPKKILRYYISQYLLSRTYADMFNEDKRISVFCEEELNLHHIIPLGSVKNIKESNQKLRRDESNILNSPMNFALITAKSNREIASKTYSDYRESINQNAYSGLKFFEMYDTKTKEGIINILKTRFEHISGDVKSEIQILLDSGGETNELQYKRGSS